jgi:hypothetical protein
MELEPYAALLLSNAATLCMRSMKEAFRLANAIFAGPAAK